MSKHSITHLRTDGTIIGEVDEFGKAWHGGGHFAGAIPLDEVRRMLDVHVRTTEIYVVDIDAPMGFRAIPGKIAVLDEDSGHCFQVAGEGWRHHDYNEVLVDNVITLLDSDSSLRVGSVVALGHKEQAVVQVRPQEGITVGGDMILPWLAAFSSLDSSWATGYKPVTTRIVCDNTAGIAYGERAQMYKIKHTRNSRLKVAEAREMIGMMFDGIPALEAEIDRFQHTPLPDHQFRMVVDRLVPIPDNASDRSITMATNKRDIVHNLWNYDTRVAPYKGTVWGGIQAFNTATHHKFTVRGESKGISRVDRQAERTVTGKIEQVDAATIDAINAVFESLALTTV